MHVDHWDEDTLLKNAAPYLNHIITVGDAQALGYCVNGQRRLWHSMQGPDKLINGISFESFIKEGVTVRWLLNTRNPYAYTLVNFVVRKLING